MDRFEKLTSPVGSAVKRAGLKRRFMNRSSPGLKVYVEYMVSVTILGEFPKLKGK